MRIPSSLEPWATRVTLPGSGRQLFCYDAGPRDASAMMLVHGLGDEADTWRRVVAPLSQRFRVVAPDLPGFGRSPLPRHVRLRPPFLAAVLLELAAHLGLRETALVGSSLGALLCQVMALSRPELVSRLVLVDGGLLAMNRFNPALLLMLIPGIGERRYRGFASDLEAAWLSLFPYYANLGALPQEQRDFLRERVAERVTSTSQMRAYFSSFRGLVTWMALAGRRAGRRASASGIPATYVWGEQDHILPLAEGTSAHRQHPGSHLAVIPGAGHLPHQETPERFLEAVAEAMARGPAAASAPTP